jgi:uncharacterized surface protein with fasciclin (FAS1) repeats
MLGEKMSRMKKLAVILLLLLIFGLAAPVVVAQISSQSTMFQNLARIGDFSTLTNEIRTAGLDTTLAGPGQYTLFAPNNAAFNKIPADSLGALSNDKAKLGDLLKYHVVPGKMSYSDLSKLTSVKTVSGATLPVGFNNGALTVGGARVLNQGIDSSNGMIYPVDNVLTPPGFAMPQASRSTGLPLGWLAGIIGAIILAGILLYLLASKSKRKQEMPAGKYQEPRAKVAERPPVEEHVRADDTMRQVRESVSTPHEPVISDITKNVNLPLAGASAEGLNMLINNGMFANKQDFLGFLGKTYLQNNVGAALAGGSEPSTSMIMDIINKTGIAKGFMEGDVKKYLVPLLITGFMAVYNYLNKKPAVKTV